ncbi:Transducin family protein / WD-40 repeat family protein [Zea mays]|uniref:Transducin family protein / WD-40 repeat family protein n=1 Tax=Zea mays TaxID=4577 RepID=A0A1D6NCD9_MAIZE|nr:Transducin family protein / WD-40 repeat family protein [Zea mays]
MADWQPSGLALVAWSDGRGSVTAAVGVAYSLGERGVVRVWCLESCVCVFEQQTSDVTVNSENEETRRGFTSAVMLPNDQGLLCVTADQQFLFYCPKRTDDGDFELSLYRRLIGYNDEILVLKFIGEEEQCIAVATNLEQVRVYDVASMSCSYVLAGHTEIVVCIDTFVIPSWFLYGRIGEESRLRVAQLYSDLVKAGKQARPEKFEIPTKIKLTLQPWTSSLRGGHQEGIRDGPCPVKKAEDYRNSLQQEAQAKSQALHFEDELARKRMPVTARDMHSRYIPQQDYFSEGLYTFDIGQNDLAGEFYSRTEDQVIVSIPTILLEFENGLKKLYDQGARKFWIHNTGPLGCLPQNIALFGKDPSQLDELHCVAKHNRAAKLFNL